MPHDHLNAAVAVAGRQVKLHPHDTDKQVALDDARRALRERQLAQAITTTVSKAPPLTDEQVDRLVRLLRGAA